MVTVINTLVTASILAEGFQGFEPLTKSFIDKAQLDKRVAGIVLDGTDVQMATFEVIVTEEVVDDDAGNGKPLTYTKNSTLKHKVVARGDDVLNITNNLMEGQDIVVEGFNSDTTGLTNILYVEKTTFEDAEPK